MLKINGYGMLRQSDLDTDIEEGIARSPSSAITPSSDIYKSVSLTIPPSPALSPPTSLQPTASFSNIMYAKMRELSNAKAFQRMFTELMNATERRLFYFVLFSTFFCAALRLIFFIFIAGIIDLLADSYYSDLHNICNVHEFIHCTSNQSLIHVFTVTLIITSICASLFAFSRDTLTSHAVCSFLSRLNCIVFDQIMNQNLSFFGVRSTQDLRYLLTNHMVHIRLSLHDIVIIIESLIHFLCGITYLLIINTDIALIIIASFVILLILSVIYIKKNEIVNIYRKKAFKAVINSVEEMLNYITTIKTFSKEDDESYVYSECIYKAYNGVKEKNSLLYAFAFWMNNIVYFTILSIIWYTAFLIYNFNTRITLGVLSIDLFILVSLNWSIYKIVILAPNVIGKCGQSLLTVFDIIDITKANINRKRTVSNVYIPRNQSIDNCSIQIKNITFAYPNNKKKKVLHNISMQFTPSTTTALVGRSGSGKSTILKLLMRLFTAESGNILIDGMDINEYSLPFLHSEIGYVAHNIHLFENRSIGDNIKFGMKLDKKHHNLFDSQYFDEESMYFWRQFKSITQSQVEEAAKMANAHDFIMATQHGYDTKIGGDLGIQLSDGEKQRIGIARALLLDPKVLLLDEAMAAVDAVSKRLIQESLDRIMHKRCVIVIAHRLKTVQNAHRIYLIKNGQNVGNGIHEELIKNNEYYIELTNNCNEISVD